MLAEAAAQPAPNPVSEQELKQAYVNSVQSLKDYMSLSNLMSYDIKGLCCGLAMWACVHFIIKYFNTNFDIIFVLLQPLSKRK